MGLQEIGNRFLGAFTFLGFFVLSKLYRVPSSQSRPFLVKVLGFTGIAALIGWLAVLFLVLKLRGTSEKKSLCINSSINQSYPHK